MDARVQRLKKLLVLQEQLKAMHELRHAGFVAGAIAAKQEAAEIADRFNADDSMSGLFPEVYQRRIASALAREDANLQSAGREAANVAAANARTNMVERNWREARGADERQRGDRERLEIIGHRPMKPGAK
ncbi:hypothetical protein [Mesorhizobium marinum]|uniref:Flagellar export protein FliJ n=1 Tax=Mesorhizobium marinum TaxID=3228790 RepID=A0ABV3QTP4_9HYPH